MLGQDTLERIEGGTDPESSRVDDVAVGEVALLDVVVVPGAHLDVEDLDDPLSTGEGQLKAQQDFFAEETTELLDAFVKSDHRVAEYQFF